MSGVINTSNCRYCTGRRMDHLDDDARRADARIMPLCPDGSGRRFRHYGTPKRMSMSWSLVEIKGLYAIVAGVAGAGPTVRADHPLLRKLLPKLKRMAGRAKARENSDG